MTQQWVDIGEGRRLWVNGVFPDAGHHANPLLVFLHEGLGSIAQWKGFHRQVADQLKLPWLAFDRYGYGLSTPRPRPWPSEFMAEEAFGRLPLLLERLGLYEHPLILIGHSDGGSIALLAGSESKLNIRAIIAISMHVVMEPRTRTGLTEIKGKFREKGFRARLERYHEGHYEDTVFGWNDALLAPGDDFWDIRKKISLIKCPVLIIQGEHDEFGSLLQVTSVLDSVRGSEALLLNGCGHHPHIQCPEKLVGGMAIFLQNRI